MIDVCLATHSACSDVSGTARPRTLDLFERLLRGVPAM